jgi:hypothetical protein
MAYERVAGTIQAFNRTGKNFKLDDDNWYSAFKIPQLQGAVVGDTIEFDMEAKDVGDKTFFNVKGDVTFLDGAPDDAPAPPARSSARDSAGSSSRRPAPRAQSAPARGGSRGGSAPAREAATASAADPRGGRPLPAGHVSDAARQESIQRQVALKEGVTAAAALLAGFDGEGMTAESFGQDVLYFAELFNGFIANAEA